MACSGLLPPSSETWVARDRLVANFVADGQLFKSHVNTFQLTTSLNKAQKNIITAVAFLLRQPFNMLYGRKHWPAHCTAFAEFRFIVAAYVV